MSFADFFGARYALKLFVMTSIIAAFGVMAAVMNGLLAGIVAVWPEWAQTGAYMLPLNTGACVSAYTTATIAKWAYQFQKERLTMIGNG
jgi:hypothetical protein